MGQAARADGPVAEKEVSLDAIVENFDGFIWSIYRDLQYIVLNTALRRKIKERVGVDARAGLFNGQVAIDPSPGRGCRWCVAFRIG
jgi:hypothetical protein